MSKSIRQKGFRLLTISGFAFFAIVGLLWWLDTKGWHYVPWMVAIPAGFALSGAIQLTTGIPFSELAGRWDSLKGWQRGVLGMSILLAVAVVITFVLAMYVIYTGK